MLNISNNIMQTSFFVFVLFLFLICIYKDFSAAHALTPKFLIKYIEIYKKEGFKGVIKKGGWKLLLYFFLFYLIRDSILYILIPYLVWKGIF